MRSAQVATVPLLTQPQLKSFKADGYLVLPDALDVELVKQLRDESWREIESFVRLRQDEPSSWGPLLEEDVRHLPKRRPDKNNSHAGGDPRFEGSGHRFYLKNGADELHLNVFPRALWSVVEQLLGEGTVVWPRGIVNGMISGPCFMNASTESGLSTHWATEPRWPPPMATETLSTTPTAAGHLNGQATRGLYCTLPNSNDPRLPAGEPAGAKQRTPTSGDKFWPSVHSDGGGDSRVRLRATAFIDDCPPGSGGFTLWKGSHTTMWNDQWHSSQRSNSRHADKTPAQLRDEWDTATRQGMNYRQNMERHRGVDGYNGKAMDALRQQKPIEISGNAGTVVLWHGCIAHVIGQNSTSDVIRVASIHDFHKTPTSLSDEILRERASRSAGEPLPDIWEDWSREVQTACVDSSGQVFARL
jgi:hypothetical protein